MHSIPVKPHSFVFVAMMLLCGISFTSTAQISKTPNAPVAKMTNVIPANIFLTDDGFLFWHRQRGERVVDVQKIKEATNSLESRPAKQDAEGHWGEVHDGLQMSLRFKKQIFTNGEPIDAVLLIRNITNQPVVYFRPTRVLAAKDGKPLKRKDDTGIISVSMPPETTVFPQTQQKSHERLDQIYDLTQSGEYFFQAECHRPKVISQEISVLIK